MFCSRLCIVAAAACLVSVSSFARLAADDAAGDPKALDGLWAGSWGLRIEPDGVVHQPVVAELMIKGDHVEMLAFPTGMEHLTGSIRTDARARQIRIAPTVAPGSPPANEIVYRYEVKDGDLTLTDEGGQSIRFGRRGIAHAPLANAQVEFVTATGSRTTETCW